MTVILTKLQLEKQYEEESKLLFDTKAWLQRQPDVMLIRISDRYAKGYSDLFACVGGIFVAIELKDIDGKASAHQLLFLEDVKRHGGIGNVCRTLGDVVECVEGARKLCMRLTT